MIKNLVNFKGVFLTQKLTELKKTKIMKNSYSSFKPPGELSNLEEIELIHKKNVPDLSPLEKLTKLKNINFLYT